VLSQFLRSNHDEIIARCRARVAKRMAPRPTTTELEHGIPMFLGQLEQMLESELGAPSRAGVAAKLHGGDLMRQGFTVAQVVHDYGDACQTITELAIELKAPISTEEFRALNKCLDDAIADAVTEYEHQREVNVVAETERGAEHRSTEQLGLLTHELRNLLGTAMLSYDALRTGSVGIASSTGAVLGRSLVALRDLVDRSMTQVRLSVGIDKPERIVVVQFVEDLEVSAILSAKAYGVQFIVGEVEAGLTVEADRQLLASVIANLLQNAFKFTRKNGRVWIRAKATGNGVTFEVEDECGGLPPGKAEHLFEPYEQHGSDRSGLGLGLAMCARAVGVLHGQIAVSDYPGRGCMFSVDLPHLVAVAPT
jgi:signal transduction histidine kinase